MAPGPSPRAAYGFLGIPRRRPRAEVTYSLYVPVRTRPPAAAPSLVPAGVTRAPQGGTANGPRRHATCDGTAPLGGDRDAHAPGARPNPDPRADPAPLPRRGRRRRAGPARGTRPGRPG